MKTWVFNQAMLDVALKGWLEEQVQIAGSSLEGAEVEYAAATRKQIEDFLNSPQAVKAKMFLKAKEQDHAVG